MPTASKPAPPRWQLPRGRLYYRELRILDALLALQSRCDGRVRETAYRQARGQGSPPGEAHFIAAAAMVVDAAHQAGRPRPRRAPSRRAAPGCTPLSSPTPVNWCGWQGR